MDPSPELHRIQPSELRAVNRMCDAYFCEGNIPVDYMFPALRFHGMARHRQFRSSICNLVSNNGQTCSVSVFRKGRIVMCGMETEERAALELLRLCYETQRHFRVRVQPIGLRTNNIVCSANVSTGKDFEIDMDLFCCDNQLDTVRKHFRGPNFTPSNVKGIPDGANISIVIFPRGPTVVTGVRELAHSAAGYAHLRKRLRGMQVGHQYRALTPQEKRLAAARQRSTKAFAAKRRGARKQHTRVYARKQASASAGSSSAAGGAVKNTTANKPRVVVINPNDGA